MPKKNNSKTNRSSKNSKNLRALTNTRKRFTIIALVVVVVVFGAIGAKAVQDSQAAIVPWYCPNNSYYQFPPPYRDQICVEQIQKMLNSVGWQYDTVSGFQRLSVDGKFGPATAKQVEIFARSVKQYPMPPSQTYGSVTRYPQGSGQWSTWKVLCGYYQAANGRNSVWLQTGCGRIPGMPFN